MKLKFKLFLGAALTGASIFAGCGDSATEDPTDAGTDVAKVDGSVDSSKTDGTTTDADVATFTVGGTITGYTGTGLVLENGATSVTVPKSATSYTLSTKVAAGTAYDIKVKTQPSDPTQTCTVTNGKGTVTANINNINVNCVTNTYDVTATVVGLKGTGLVLQNNAGDDLAVSVGDAGGSTNATFATKIASGANYAVTVKTQPSMQTCTVMGGTGTVVAGPITTVTVTCVTNKYTVGGTVAGLAGAGLVLQNNAGDDATVNANGTYAFPTAPEDGTTYAVTVKTQPTNLSQTCTVANGTGTINGANVTNVDVTCVTNSFSVGGTVSGLVGSGLVIRNNGGNDIAVSANGSFAFPAVISGGAYAVTVATQPTNPWQTCTVTNGTGTVANGAVTNVAIACTTNTYTVGGTVTGLSAGTLVLRNNGGNNLSLTASGSFTFSTAVASGGAYNVTVFTQPGAQCTVSNGTGTVAGANVTNVAVTCVLCGNGVTEGNEACDDGNAVNNDLCTNACAKGVISLGGNAKTHLITALNALGETFTNVATDPPPPNSNGLMIISNDGGNIPGDYNAHLNSGAHVLYVGGYGGEVHRVWVANYLSVGPQNTWEQTNCVSDWNKGAAHPITQFLPATYEFANQSTSYHPVHLLSVQANGGVVLGNLCENGGVDRAVLAMRRYASQGTYTYQAFDLGQYDGTNTNVQYVQPFLRGLLAFLRGPH